MDAWIGIVAHNDDNNANGDSDMMVSVPSCVHWCDLWPIGD